MNCETGKALHVPLLQDIQARPGSAKIPSSNVTARSENLKGEEVHLGVYVAIGGVTVASLVTVYICVRTHRAGSRVGEDARSGRVRVTVGVTDHSLHRDGPMTPLATSTALPK